MSHALDELADLSADLKAWLEWEQCLGGVSWPRERVPPPAPQTRAPRRAAAAPPVPTPSRPQSAPVAPRQDPQSAKTDPPASSQEVEEPGAGVDPADVAAARSKWASYAKPEPLAVGVGPVGAPLALIWTEGVSEEAEQMLDKMLKGVLHLQREDICVISLSRVRAAPSRFRADLLTELERLRPGLLLVMGTLGTRAIAGDSAEPSTARTDWHALEGQTHMWAARVTHHPEHIRLRAASGDQDPRREAFEDLQAVAARLTAGEAS